MQGRNHRAERRGHGAYRIRRMDELARFVDRLERADAFSGAVLLAHHDELIFESACGLACKSFNVANRVDTRFNLGSMNKMFTAVAVAQLVERGVVGWDDAIGRYLSAGWLSPEHAARITIDHLLTHTSGLGSYFNEQFEHASRLRFREIDDFRPLIRDDAPAFEPGHGWQYSNSGFMLLGAMIEHVTGGSYYDYIRRNIHEPAGMIQSDCYDVDRPIANLAIGYSRRHARGEHTHPGEPPHDPSGDGAWETNTFKHVVRGGPAGGGYSTVRDLWRFSLALTSGLLCERRTAERLWTPTPASLKCAPYGRGFSVQGGPADRIVGHAGGFPGISAQLDIYLDRGFTLAVLSNYDKSAYVVADQVRELLARSA
ncbi:MAG: Penicillin-binding protein 4* [Phycisphaerae bacterium]|nr:Penicillin-binding protein 4* [Phycisphaerae bacterium]